MNPLGAAVIGCGVIGPAHAASLAGIPGVQLRYVCDVQPQRAQRLAQEFHAQPVTDSRVVFDDPNIHLVSLATPHPAHAELFTAALAAGKAVLCEKPLASTWTDIELMVRLARAAPQISSGIFQHRFSPVIQQLKTFVEQGDLGRLTGGKLWFRCHRGPQYYQADPWRGKAVEEGGGVLLNQAIHFIDLLTFFLGEPRRVRGRIERLWVPDIEVEDAGTAQVIYEGGVPGEMDIANLPHKSQWQANVTVQGEKGSFTIGSHHRPIELAGFTTAMTQALEQRIHQEEALPMLPGKPEYGPWHMLQFQDFVDAYRHHRQPKVTVADAALSNRLTLGIYVSSQHDGQAVDLSQPYKHPYRFVPLPLVKHAIPSHP